jgi:hypothetical protein
VAAVRYPYLGSEPRLYTQYMDAGELRPLDAKPGNSYAITAAPGYDGSLAVPPADGRWGKAAGEYPAITAPPAEKSRKGASA